ncbi:MAG TPA: thioredoxin [Nitrososphaerales archaeon]|nr:thioredoxin [Nitrososphaerales archaeon]HUK74519.1 thioredoxin [Nitrososphaerales archaeon]
MSDSELDKIVADRAKRLLQESQHKGEVATLTASNFDKTVGSSKPTFVDFWAVWCGPCKVMEPVVERLAAKMGGSVTFGKLNVDEHPAIATRYEVQSIPTFMVFKNGKPVDAVIGTMPEAQLEQRVRKASGA